MTKRLKTYWIRGVIRSNYSIDVNTKINAYSKRQAKFKLVFDLKKNRSIAISPRQLFNDISKSRLSIIEV